MGILASHNLATPIALQLKIPVLLALNKTTLFFPLKTESVEGRWEFFHNCGDATEKAVSDIPTRLMGQSGQEGF